VVPYKNDRRLYLQYDGQHGSSFAIEKEGYKVRESVLPGDIFV